jgi:hypothetical protein
VIAAPVPLTVNTTGTPARRFPAASVTTTDAEAVEASGVWFARIGLTVVVAEATPEVVLGPVKETFATVTVPYVIVAVFEATPAAVDENVNVSVVPVVPASLSVYEMKPFASVTPRVVVETVLRPATLTLTGTYCVAVPYWFVALTSIVVDPPVADRTAV